MIYITLLSHFRFGKKHQYSLSYMSTFQRWSQLAHSGTVQDRGLLNEKPDLAPISQMLQSYQLSHMIDPYNHLSENTVLKANHKQYCSYPYHLYLLALNNLMVIKLRIVYLNFQQGPKAINSSSSRKNKTSIKKSN